ncbi:REST corepressor 3 isoform X1 [Anopheles stephensi]|uniref:REST corepressor 3 isoform X1 n=1 Tax=Anopheles stephensi TaxID=30069 RepID=UPI001658C27F|nr:REST corepressor 3 isoform X1 [Anopheles stephensi]
MVLAERTAEGGVRNGKRSRGPSPNGHAGAGVVTTSGAGGAATDSSSDDENSRKNGNTSKATKAKSEYEEKIRVGRDYQAVCPELIAPTERKPEQLNDRALLVWSPTKEIPDDKLEDYITVAKEKYGYNGEQALGMLFWHKHDLERAILDLANFTPFPDEWSAEDRVLFEQAFQFHGKSFHRIRQMLPDKSIASLVKFYYSWKKTRSRTSVMDRQEKMKKNDSSENGSDHGSNEESDNEDKSTSNSTTAGGSNSAAGNGNGNVPNNGSAAGGSNKGNEAENESNGNSGGGAGATNEGSLNCAGCGVTCSEVHASSHGKLCGSCYHHWRRTGVLRPTTGPSFMNKRTRGSNILGKSGDSHKRRPPKGMYINHDDIVRLASTAQNGGDGIVGGGGGGDGVGGIVEGNNDGGGYRKGIQSNDLLASMDREIVSLLTQIQNNKQKGSGLKRKIDDVLELLKSPEVSSVRLNSRWNHEELMLAVQGVRMYGRDFQAIADTLGSKTETQVRTFFMNYRRRFNLDAVLKEFEATNAAAAAAVGAAGEVPLDQTKASAAEMRMAPESGTAGGGGTAAIGTAAATATTATTGDNEGIDPHKTDRSCEKEKQDSAVSAAEDVEIMEVK